MKMFKWVLFLVFVGNISAQTIAQNDTFGFSGGYIGVIGNNKIQFYQSDGKKWSVNSALDMELPKEHASVFGFSGGYIGVTGNNKIQFYQSDGKKWSANSALGMELSKDTQAVQKTQDEAKRQDEQAIQSKQPTPQTSTPPNLPKGGLKLPGR